MALGRSCALSWVQPALRSPSLQIVPTQTVGWPSQLAVQRVHEPLQTPRQTWLLYLSSVARSWWHTFHTSMNSCVSKNTLWWEELSQIVTASYCHLKPNVQICYAVLVGNRDNCSSRKFPSDNLLLSEHKSKSYYVNMQQKLWMLELRGQKSHRLQRHTDIFLIIKIKSLVSLMILFWDISVSTALVVLQPGSSLPQKPAPHPLWLLTAWSFLHHQAGAPSSQQRHSPFGIHSVGPQRWECLLTTRCHGSTDGYDQLGSIFQLQYNAYLLIIDLFWGMNSKLLNYSLWAKMGTPQWEIGTFLATVVVLVPT